MEYFCGADVSMDGTAVCVVDGKGEVHLQTKNAIRHSQKSFFEIEELGLQVAPVRQQQPSPVAAFGLDMRLAEPPRAHDVGEPARMRLVGFVALCRRSGAHM